MIDSAREGLRDLIQRVSLTVTQWSVNAQPATAWGETVPVGVSFNPTAPTPTAAGLQGKARITLRIIAANERGDDGIRKRFNSGTNALVANVVGQREYTISASCFSYGSEREAAEILEKLRTRLRRPSSLAGLRALNMSLIKLHPITELSRLKEGVFTSNLDLKLGWAINDADSTFDGNWIQTAPVTGTTT